MGPVASMRGKPRTVLSAQLTTIFRSGSTNSHKTVTVGTADWKEPAVTPRRIIATASAASLAVAGIAVGGIAQARHTVMLEVDGVSQPVTVWGGTVSDALASIDVQVGEHDLISPTPSENIASVDHVVVRTAKPYDLTIDGEERTVWSTSSSIDTILADADTYGSTVAIGASRSSMRAELQPLVSRARTLPVIETNGNVIQNVAVRAGQDIRHVIENNGIKLSPLDRVTLESANGELSVRVQPVTRGRVSTDTPVNFSKEERKSDALFEGERIVEQEGTHGANSSVVWQETVDGEVTYSAVLSADKKAEPRPEIVTVGTRKVTPEALLAAGIDPKAQLEEGTESDGRKSVRFRAKPGDISSQAELDEIRGIAEAEGLTISSTPTGTYSGEDPRGIAQQMVSQRGWSDSEFQCLLTLWDRESHWNPYAANAWSGAYGIPQALPGSKMASAGADWQTNPATQITWGLGYVAGRYGTPCGALGHSNSVGWY